MASQLQSQTPPTYYFNNITYNSSYYKNITTATVTQVNSKLSKSGGTMTGVINMNTNKITNIVNRAKQQNSYNIIDKAAKLLNEMKTERIKLLKGRRVFYHRLKALDLIDESNDDINSSEDSK